ncbi:MAG: hypothetical protein LBD79_00090 [Treponema sp.]|jgi:hypothetical protein|nr:hypothetical protein [Treponema sp.]
MALEVLPDAQGQPILHKPFFAGQQADQQKTAQRSSAPAQHDTSQEHIVLDFEEHEKGNFINTSFLFPSSNKPLIKKLDPSFKELIDSILR